MACHFVKIFHYYPVLSQNRISFLAQTTKEMRILIYKTEGSVQRHCAKGPWFYLLSFKDLWVLMHTASLTYLWFLANCISVYLTTNANNFSPPPQWFIWAKICDSAKNQYILNINCVTSVLKIFVYIYLWIKRDG